jgi:agmatine deiminase
VLAPFATIITQPFGDIWLRDTGPIVVTGPGPKAALSFGFNGWGGKYDLPGDDTIGRRLGESAGLRVRCADWILEGGAIDVDGTGLAVTTEECLLNPNRNSFFSRAEVEARLRADLGIDRLLWLASGLMNDHTDGHVDNVARFVGTGRIAIPEPAEHDPNEAVYRDAAIRARRFGLDVAAIPSPGLVRRGEEIIPASYMNFYIGNAALVVPHYGAANDEAAVAALQALFPGREAVGLRADHILTGGGSFHCISQQVPA